MSRFLLPFNEVALSTHTQVKHTMNIARTLAFAAYVCGAFAVEKELSPSLRKVAVSISFSVFWNGR